MTKLALLEMDTLKGLNQIKMSNITKLTLLEMDTLKGLNQIIFVFHFIL